MPEPHDDPLIAATFLDALTQDRAEGRDVGLAGYLQQFPGHEDQIRREWEALQGADPTPSANRHIAHYELLDVLGRGGQGIVHRARDLRLGREVALKILRGAHLPTPASLERFRREAEVAARLDHPGICRILDTGVDAGTTYIAMQLVPGRSLADEIAGSESPAETRAEFERWASIFALAARALHAAHAAGVVHRDVKPGNVMVTDDDQAVLLDFGLARDEEGMELTRTGDVFGTPAYMAPEQLEGDPAKIGPPCDVYGLGATLFECLTWRPPFAVADGQGIYRSILDREAPSPQAFHRAVPHDLAVLALTALAKSPAHRYSSALAMAEDLERFVRREPLRARPVGPLERSWRWARANPLVAGLTAALFVVLGASVVLLSSQNRELTEALEDARAGRASKREREVAALVRDGYQRLFSADSRGADALFDRALVLAPDDRTALIGRVWFDVMRPGTARQALDRHVPASTTDPDALWLRGVALELIGANDEARAVYERAGEQPDNHLRCYLRGLSAARGFMTGNPQDAQSALPWFEKAILRAPAPRFAYYHSQLMAASIAGDGATQDRAAELLEHHWGDAPATLEAIAQFYMGRDTQRAEQALRRLMVVRPSPTACCGLAHLAQSRDDGAAARKWLDRGAALPEAEEFAAIWHLRALLRMGADPTGAIADLRRCLQIDPAFFPAALQLDGLLRSAGEPDAAAETLRATLDALEPGAPGRAAVEAALQR